MRNAIFNAALDTFADLRRGLGRIVGVDTRELATSDVAPLTVGIDGAIEAFVGPRRHRAFEVERAARRRVADVVPGKAKRLHHMSPSFKRQCRHCRPMLFFRKS